MKLNDFHGLLFKYFDMFDGQYTLSKYGIVLSSPTTWSVCKVFYRTKLNSSWSPNPYACISSWLFSRDSLCKDLQEVRAVSCWTQLT